MKAVPVNVQAHEHTLTFVHKPNSNNHEKNLHDVLAIDGGVGAGKLRLIAEGYINKEIARSIGVSVKTVETHRTAAMLKAGVRAAPDLVRYNLIGGDAAIASSAQLLWSRSRGFVFSGSRVPPLPAGSIYQVWLVTTGAPVSAGIFSPDSSGRV